MWLNYETSELNISSEEAQLSHIMAQYSSKEAKLLSYEAKAILAIMEYRQVLYINNTRRQIDNQYHRNWRFISP